MEDKHPKSSLPEDPSFRRKTVRFAVNLPAYVSVPGGFWAAKGNLSNVSADGLLIELPSPPPFGEGATVLVEWIETSVIGEVRHVTCRPGFVRIGVLITMVQYGRVLACVPDHDLFAGADEASQTEPALGELTLPADIWQLLAEVSAKRAAQQKPQASASAIVLALLEQHRAELEAELKK